MGKSKLMKVSYYDPKAEVRLTTYADTLVIDGGNMLAAIRFGGYPEQVKAMSDAIYGCCGFDIEAGGGCKRILSQAKQYRRQMSHDGLYAIRRISSRGVSSRNVIEMKPKTRMPGASLCLLSCGKRLPTK